jgi:predicted ATP-binding protein involved in virulence
MKINHLTLLHFRRYPKLAIDFDRQLTVIVGVNGSGKTSILDAVAILLGRLLARFPRVTGRDLQLSDLQMQPNALGQVKLAEFVRCYAEAELANPTEGAQSIRWSSTKLRDKSPKTALVARSDPFKDTDVGIRQLHEYADRLVDAENTGQSYLMPVIAYYGTDRATFNTPLRRRNFSEQFARFEALEGALNPAANFKRVFEWFHARENEEAREQKKRQSFAYKDPELDTARQAIEQFFPEFKRPRTETNPLRFVVDRVENDQERTYDLNQLSDGYRTSLALVADLACRMTEANPPSSEHPNPLAAPAVVLIDEIELHLHPGWQQKILKQLQTVFSQTQWIVTTHSPQVLTAVPPESIRALDWVNGQPDIRGVDFSLGAQSQFALEAILGVQARPPELEISKQLAEYLQLVNQDQWDSERAKELHDTLLAWCGGLDPDWIKAQMDIRVRQWRRQNSAPAV